MMHFFAIFSHGSAILDNRAGGNMKVTMIFVWKLISCIITEVRKSWKICFFPILYFVSMLYVFWQCCLQRAVLSKSELH